MLNKDEHNINTTEKSKLCNGPGWNTARILP